MPEPLGLLPNCAVGGLAASDAEGVLTALADRVVAGGFARDTFPAAVLRRERRYPTGLPTEVPCAIPHADPGHVLRAGLAVAALAEPVAFGKMGTPGQQVRARLVVMLCVTDATQQVGALQGVLACLRDTPAVEAMLARQAEESFDRHVTRWLAGGGPLVTPEPSY